MCGITGYYGPRLDEKLLLESVNCLQKRGPDAKGTYLSSDGQVGLGHRRLSVLDVSVVANQPMTQAAGRYTIIYNGEIYNFKALKKNLEKEGYVFKTTSDTEVILNLYHKYENKCWAMLDGFFSVAIYDNHKKTVTLSRDRLGIKPLYYSLEENEFRFGSEMKALIKLGVNKEIDSTALYYYFRLNYIPAPYSIFTNVKKLAPGSFLVFNGEDLHQEAYYKLDEEHAVSSTLNYQEAKNQLVHLLENSVQNRLVSDVPLGTFLSGGIDSSVITALASKHRSSLKTFSVGFKDNKFFDETHYARLVAAQYKTDHLEIYLTNDDLYQSLEELLDYTDEPFADSSALAVNALCKETRKHVTVALSGDGADELFAGYNKYLGEYKIQNPGTKEKLASLAHPAWNVLPKSRNGKLTNTIRKLHKYSAGSRLDKRDRYFNWCAIGEESLIHGLLLDKTFPDVGELTTFVKPEKGITDILLNDIHLVLPDDMLTKVDRMSMANSLEVRVPFLDHKLVEFANSLPDEFKINGNQKKRILQDAFKAILPEELYNRPKQGFEVPLLGWLKNELDFKIRNTYLERDFIKEQGLFDYETVKKLLNQLHSTNPEDSHATVWALIVFQHWYKKHID